MTTELEKMLEGLKALGDNPHSFELPKRTPTLVGMPKYDFHTVPADERATPRPSAPPPPPPRPRQRRDTVTVPSARFDDEPVIPTVDMSRRRRITAPVALVMMTLPTDNEMKAAQAALDQASELDRVRDTLLCFPEWVPVSQPMLAVTREARRFRQIAASLLHCDPVELED